MLRTLPIKFSWHWAAILSAFLLLAIAAPATFVQAQPAPAQTGPTPTIPAQSGDTNSAGTKNQIANIESFLNETDQFDEAEKENIRRNLRLNDNTPVNLENPNAKPVKSADGSITFPALTGRVVDNANLLNPSEEAALTDKLKQLETQSQRQFVVATVPSLDGYEIADYAYQLGRAWEIGDAERNDGIILLIAPNERKMWIAVGYGLEGIMTDALASQIVRNDITPLFKQGDMAGGIFAGADKIVSQLALPPEEARAVAAQANQQQYSEGDGGSWIPVVFWIIVMIFVLSSMFGGSRKGKKYRGGAGPVIIWGGGSGGFGGGSSGGGFGGGGFSGGGFSGGGGSFGGGGAGGGW